MVDITVDLRMRKANTDPDVHDLPPLLYVDHEVEAGSLLESRHAVTIEKVCFELPT